MNSRETVLLTGFGPFGKFQVNASWESVRLLNNYENDKYRIITHEIPVEYDQVDNRIPKLWTDLTPKVCPLDKDLYNVHSPHPCYLNFS